MFIDIVESLLTIEGGYVDNPNDSGGKTNWGITERVARQSGYYGNMKDMRKDDAIRIYWQNYWMRMELDNIYPISPLLAKELFDTGVNMGISRAAEFLQRSLNVMNQQESLYADLKIDADIGPKTLDALVSYLKHRHKDGEKVLITMLNSLQGEYYITLAERRQKEETFVFGWFKHRVIT